MHSVVMVLHVSLCAALSLLMKQAVRPDSPLKGHERTVQYLQHLGELTVSNLSSVAVSLRERERAVQYLQHLGELTV